jgi:2-phospho-L-lactate guanylyltransferase
MKAALVPAKSLDRAKGRLAGLLSEEERRSLALAMLEDVVGALRRVPQLDLVSVVSPDPEVLTKAEELGVAAIAEPPSVRGINQALQYAAAHLQEQGAETLLVVLADVPSLQPADIEAVLDALPAGRGLVICPAARKGTSALAMRPIGLIPFRFGPDSFVLHRREAAARGIEARVLRIESLANDIDEPSDLLAFSSQPAGKATHRWLANSGLAARLQT